MHQNAKRPGPAAYINTFGVYIYIYIYIYIYPPFFRVFITSAGHYFTSPREQQIIQAFMFIPFRIFGFLIFEIL
jgi:hypothetical protein